MSIKEYCEIDSNFDESVFLSKVANMFIKFYSSISTNKLETVKHFVNDSVYNLGINEIKENKSKQMIHMYDMLNVKDSKIISIDETDEKYVIYVSITARYLDYYLDEKSYKRISGDDKNRIEIPYILELCKIKNSKENTLVKRCPTCGASLLINSSGKCEYCGSIYNLEDFDFIITKIDKS